MGRQQFDKVNGQQSGFVNVTLIST